MGRNFKQVMTISITVFDIDEVHELLRIKKIPLNRGIDVLENFLNNKVG